jgi:hypothetical protein
MKRKAVLSALLALVVAAPAVIAPKVTSLTPTAQAQAEYPDVPLDHWAYNAINKLSQAGIIEGYPNGTYSGGRAMTRYEFAVAIARLLQNMPAAGVGPAGPQGVPGPQGPAGVVGPRGESVPQTLPNDLVRRQELNDAIAALRNEFAPELKALGVRVGDLENRVTALENRVVKPPRITFSASLLHRMGLANYIDNENYGRLDTDEGVAAANNAAGNYLGNLSTGGTAARNKFSYTDFELRLTDRVTDKLSLNAALRSISGTIEDPWLIGAGEYGGNDTETDDGLRDGFQLREANAVADLGNRLGARNVSLILGRQRTKIAQGLLYDNDLAPTDQFHTMFNAGPFEIGGFIGSTNNNSFQGAENPYISAGANYYIGAQNNIFGGGNQGSFVGFPGQFAVDQWTEDTEAAAHAAVNLFRVGGQPVRLGGTYLFDGVAQQRGWGADLSLTLFNRVVGIEYAAQNQYAGGAGAHDAHAYNITIPVLRTRPVDLDVAYGRASDRMEYFLASSANPFARTYGEAIFDRPIALGAPLINGADNDGTNFMAAKRVWDFNGTLRLIRRLPLQFRYYTAKGSDDVDLGSVWSVGSTFNLTQGLDLEVKYGRYSPTGDVPDLRYFRVGANVGF